MQTNWTRRDFLVAGAGLASVSFVAGKRGCAWGADDTAKKSRFPLGLQSYTFRSFPVEKAIDMAKELGFKNIEFSVKHFPPNSSDERIEAIKKKMAAEELQMFAHGVNEFGKDHEANRRVFVFAKKIGVKNLSAYPSEDAFKSLDKLVAEFDIRIAIHNHGPGTLYDKIADVLNAIKGHDPRIGACADLGHYIRSAEDPVKAIMLLNDRLFGVHLKDFAEQKVNSRGAILGKGHLDVEGVYKALAKVNFPADSGLSLEYEDNPSNPVPDVKECIAAARAAEAKAFS